MKILNFKSVWNLKHFFHSVFGGLIKKLCCKYCQLNENDMAFIQGKQELVRQFNLKNIMRDLRMSKDGLKYLLKDRYLHFKKIARTSRIKNRLQVTVGED